jgi:hypothetical protein
MGLYFGYNLTLALVAVALLFAVKSSLTGKAFKVSLILGGLAVIICTYITFSVYPDIVAVKATVTSFETMPKDTGPRAEFGKLHGISMALNMAYLVVGVAMTYLSGGRTDKAV